MLVMEDKTKIKSFIQAYFKTYFTDRNFEKLKAFFSSEMTGIGTGIHEFAETPEIMFSLYKKDLLEVSSPIKYTDLEIYVGFVSDQLSTLSCKFNIETEVDGNLLSIPNLRHSFTLIKEKGEWKILQIHVSAPNDQQVGEELYPLQKLITQNELLTKMVDKRTRELQEKNKALSNSNNTKDTLLSIISHDLRAPFNSLLGFIEILSSQYDELDSESHKKFISIISNSSKKIYNLTDNLLIWSRLQRNGFEFSPTALNLQKIVDNSLAVLEELSKDKGLEITNEISRSSIILGDKYMLSTILRNLISNAIKFTPNEGQIIISAKTESSEDGGLITVCVQDNGVGIPKNKMKKLIGSGINQSTNGTNNEEGSGIGLVLCKEFIDLHGTKIWVESKPGSGSKFYFNLKTV